MNWSPMNIIVRSSQQTMTSSRTSQHRNTTTCTYSWAFSTNVLVNQHYNGPTVISLHTNRAPPPRHPLLGSTYAALVAQPNLPAWLFSNERQVYQNESQLIHIIHTSCSNELYQQSRHTWNDTVCRTAYTLWYVHYTTIPKKPRGPAS